MRVCMNQALAVNRQRHVTFPEKQITTLGRGVAGLIAGKCARLLIAVAGAGNARSVGRRLD